MLLDVFNNEKGQFVLAGTFQSFEIKTLSSGQKLVELFIKGEVADKDFGFLLEETRKVVFFDKPQEGNSKEILFSEKIPALNLNSGEVITIKGFSKPSSLENDSSQSTIFFGNDLCRLNKNSKEWVFKHDSSTEEKPVYTKVFLGKLNKFCKPEWDEDSGKYKASLCVPRYNPLASNENKDLKNYFCTLKFVISGEEGRLAFEQTKSKKYKVEGNFYVSFVVWNGAEFITDKTKGILALQKYDEKYAKNVTVCPDKKSFKIL